MIYFNKVKLENRPLNIIKSNPNNFEILNDIFFMIILDNDKV